MEILLLILVIIVVGILSYPLVLAWLARNNAKKQLAALENDGYRVVEDVTVASSDSGEEETQIDYVVIGQPGIFLVELATQMGTITGEEPEDYWEETSFGRVKRFKNPAKKNMKSIRALREKLDNEDYVPMYSVVSFPNRARFQDLFTESAVISHSNIAGFIKGFAESKLSVAKVEELHEKIRDL